MNPPKFVRSAPAFVVLCFIAISHAQELHVNHDLKSCSIELDPSLTQGQFHKFTREAAQVFTFKLMSPAEPLGAKKFQVGIDYSITKINDADPAWNNTFSHPHETHYLGDQLAFPKLFARMGMSDRIDVGFYFTKNPEANYGFMGGEMKYALFMQPEKPWAMAVRTTYVTLLGVEDLNFHLLGADLSASKKIGRLTPYCGIGANLARAIETTSKVNLHNETVLTPRGIIGGQLSLSFFTVTAEMDVAAVSTLSLRTGFRF
ncbi:hypothetical protein HUU05_14860 [candidate division KSB1 bacterium]|nr:hypothetical protein [candidate division KSB1 bacterium]